MRLWEINLYEDDDAPIALDKLWAHFALLKEVNRMKKFSALCLTVVLFMCCLTACDMFDRKPGYDESLKCERYENSAVFTFDDFPIGETATFELERTGLGEGAIYYQVNLDEGTLSVNYKDTVITTLQPLGEFTADDEMPINSSGGYVEGDKITIIFESSSSISGEIIIAFTEDALKAVHGDLHLHKHTYSYTSAGEIGHYQHYTCGCPDTQEGTVAHYDEDNNFICDACGYVMPEHEHTYQNYQDETGHSWSYTCGCMTPPNFAQHSDGNKDGKCDDCDYRMNITVLLHEYAPWLLELEAEDIAEIKTTFEYVGVAPGRLKDISRTTDKVVIADVLGNYASLQMQYVEREETYVDGGSAFAIEFILTDGTVKKLDFNNGFYAYGLDQDDISAHRFFELDSIPTLEGYDNLEKYNKFITYSSGGTAFEHFGEDNKLIGNADGIDLLEFVALLEGEIGLLNSTYKYTIRTEFGTLYVYNEAIFGFSGLADEAQKYYKLVNGKSFSEIIPLADYPYLYLETQFVLHNSGINVFTFNVSADCNYQFVVSGSVNENTRCIVRVYSQSDRWLVFESQSANLPDEVMALAKGEYFVIVELIEANDLAVVFTVYKQKTDTNI